MCGTLLAAAAPAEPVSAAKRGCGTVYLPSIKTKAKLTYRRGTANCKTVRRMAVRWDKGQVLPDSWIVAMARENNQKRLFTISWSPGGKLRASLDAHAL